MAKVDAADWLESWIDENIQTPGYMENESEAHQELAACRADANQAGVDPTELDEAADGDLRNHLFNAVNSFTDAEVERKASSDKY